MFRFQATHFDHSRTGLGRRHPVNETQPSLKFNVDLKEYHASLDGTNTKQGRVRAGDGNRWKFNSMKIVAFPGMAKQLPVRVTSGLQLLRIWLPVSLYEHLVRSFYTLHIDQLRLLATHSCKN